ncbi:MAG: hypothetical protein RSA55_00250 [Clostridia bacterium]
MEKVLKAIVNWIYDYGTASAGMASFRDAYEAPVPKTLLAKLK